MTLEIARVTVGPLEVNCHIAGCPEHKVCAVIDPGDSSRRILAEVESRGWDVKYIINTHGHADHTGANAKIKEATGAPILIHKDDAAMATSAEMRDMAAYLGVGAPPEPDRLLEDGDVIELCPCVGFEVIHTPGHSPGGVCLRSGDVLFTGDTLFKMSIGRSDLPGGDQAELMRSIRRKILALPGGVSVHPGHGEPTTVGFEKRSNPFLIGAFA